MTKVFKSPFKIGDKVYYISKEPVEKYIPCKYCQDKKQIKKGEAIFCCKECFGNGGKTEYLPDKWRLSINCWGSYILTIGQIRVEKTGKEKEKWS